jgi:cell division protein FtsW (lipid II flippase)
MTPVASAYPGAGLRRRGSELVMLVFALLAVAVAYSAVGYAEDGRIPADMGRYAGGLGLLFLAAHLVVRRFAPYADPLLLPAAAFLNGLGLVLIHRLDLADADRARQLGHSVARPDAPLQLAWTTIGVVGFGLVLVLVRNHRMLQRYAYTAMAAGLLLLLIPAVLPASFSEVNGARIWIRVGGLSFQPSEVAKLLLEVFFASYLVAKREVLALASRRFAGLSLPRGRDLGPVLLAWAISLAILVRGRDLGTSLLFFGIFLTMLYVATERTSWLLIGLLLFVGGSFVAYHLFAHVRLRVDIWLHPFADPLGKGYQSVQALFGLATGGLTGTGLGLGSPNNVPYAKSDFITATIGEELGLTGLLAVLVLFLLIAERGLRAGLSVRDPFGKLLATGLSVGFALQVFIVVGGVTGLIPLTGLTLPFVAYGGSSLVANWVLLALLLRISDAARRPLPALSTAEDALTQVVRL